MTKYRYLDTVDKTIKQAIAKALAAPYCLHPLAINIWDYEALNRYDNRIKSSRRVYGSYLE